MCYYIVQIDLFVQSHVNLHIKQKKHNMVKAQQNLTCTEHGRHTCMKPGADPEFFLGGGHH